MHYCETMVKEQALKNSCYADIKLSKK